MSIANSIFSGDRKSRLVSLDAVRGLDMFGIIGARSISAGLVGLNLPGGATIASQLTHTRWNGFTLYDLIFPLFLYVTGVSLVLSMQKRLERGDDRRTIVKHIITRTLTLFLLGIMYNGIIIQRPFLQGIRIMGVLQRIALCYFFSSMLVLFTKPRAQAATVAVILFGYWLIMRYVPVPGYGAGIWTEEGNLERYIDSLLLPGRLYFGSWDPEGLLSTIPAVATCLLGVLTGHWLRTTRGHHGQARDAKQCAQYLFLGGMALTISGLLISPVFPINKMLWTSSFVLLTGGISAMLLAAFYWIIDIQGYRRWAFPFVVIGTNSIFIYLAARFVPFDKIAYWIVGRPFGAFFGRGQTLVTALVQLSLEGLLLLWLFNRRIFIRI